MDLQTIRRNTRHYMLAKRPCRASLGYSQYSANTLGLVSHNVSGIPMPSSALKRTHSQTSLGQAPHTAQHVRSASGSRMSLAPGRPSQMSAQRTSTSSAFADMGFSTVQRPSTMNLFGPTSSRKSFAPVMNTPAHPMPVQDGTARRSSVYTVRPSAGYGPASHQSFFATAPPANGIPTDPRRLRDLTTRTQMGQEVMEFLTQRNFELDMKHTLTHKTMTSPTQKDFNLIFQFLYHCIDPSYRFLKNIDAEVPPLLKQLRYPFEKNISKSQLAAVGGNNWSTFVGLLHWMMQLAKMMEQYAYGAYDETYVEAGFDVASDRITFNFLADAYKEWLSIEDEEDDDEEEAKRRIQPHVDVMAARFEDANQANLEQLRQLEAEGKALQEQIDELSKSAPRLAKLDEQIKVLEEDRVKFENYNTSMDGKVEKYQNRAQLLQQEIERCDEELRAAEEERDELQRQVDQQGLSVQDIDRMNSERERLQKGVESASVRLDDAKERTAKKEAETGEKLDELESLAHKYNSLGYQIGIIPASSHNAQGFEHELSLTINDGPDFNSRQQGTSQLLESDRLLHDAMNGYQAYHVLQHADLKASKRALQDLRKTISERRNATIEQDMAKMDMLDKTREALEDKHNEMETLGHRLRTAQEEFEKMREITTAQNMGSDTQIEKMEKELARIRAGVTESVQYMEQREMNTNLEYEQLTLRSAALREELHTELERMLNDIIKFKIHIQGSLESYEEFVASEVDREFAEQDAEHTAALDENVDDVDDTTCME
ncbi:hypothetical protein AMS68_000656 [Peltaster fructicola]|uniref:Kinetochore protein NDC80 n=1 Tax=Peltaster fructicola TaxID=286661 RepID=A0A6H0XKH9_9PEZI|nr:hypothetical protein AMS68_000656 [Peltaster fructicola]